MSKITKYFTNDSKLTKYFMNDSKLTLSTKYFMNESKLIIIIIIIIIIIKLWDLKFYGIIDSKMHYDEISWAKHPSSI